MPKGKKRTTVKKRGVLSEEEQLLFKRLRRGNEAARDELIRKYSSWVENIARKYHACFPAIDVSEFVAEGNRGLLEALGRYDISKSAKFSTYAWFWIVKNVQEYIGSSLALIGVPGKVSQELRRIVSQMNEERKKGKDPSLTDISKKLDMDAGVVAELLADKKNITRPLSLDKYLDEDDREQTLGDIVEDKNVEAIQKMLERSDSKVTIVELLGQLDPLEREIIKWRFGFKDNRAHALKEIGDKLKITPAKVKDMESMALIKLRRFLERSDNYDVNENI